MTPAAELRDIVKTYPGVKALRGVSLSVRRGEILSLVGENGAGKSTLMRVLSGAEIPDAGEIRLDGRPVSFAHPRDAQAAGVSTIFQELMLVPDLSIAENVFLGHLVEGRHGFLDWRSMRERAGALMRRLGSTADVATPVRHLSVAEMQLVEIAKSLSRRSRILVMDEPTASLAREEAESLFAIIRRLRADGMSVIFITHHLHEIFETCDRVVVLRDGANAGESPVEGLTERALVRMMLGRDVAASPARAAPADRRGAVAVEVRDLTRAPDLSGVSLTVHRGEVLGIAGLMGAGRTELVRAICAADRVDGGTVRVDGTLAAFASPKDALAAGIGLAPEDRKGQGLVLSMPISENVSLASLDRLAGPAGLRLAAETSQAEAMRERLAIKCASVGEPVGNLSGGNQQKVVLAKLLAAGVSVYLLDEPTRGIDIGAKAAIFDMIRALAGEGAAIVLISSALEELTRTCDRIVCLHLGRVTAEYEAGAFDMDQIMLSIMGKRAEPERLAAGAAP